MNTAITLTQAQLSDFLLNVAIVRPVFLWGPPGIGKSSLGLHPLLVEYIQTRPDHLWSQSPKHEAPFSTPRSWHMRSDTLHGYSNQSTDTGLEVLAFGCLSPHHAGQSKAFVQQIHSGDACHAVPFDEAVVSPSALGTARLRTKTSSLVVTSGLDVVHHCKHTVRRLTACVAGAQERQKS